MKLRFDSEDVSALKCFVSLAILYGIMSFVAYPIIYMKHVKPLAMDAPLDLFSEARAIEHIRKLSKEIDGRQEGRPGLDEAARYLKKQMEMFAERAGSNISIEIDETLVSGSFNLMFLGHSISFGYRNHINLLMRISSTDSKDTDPSFLVNGHFDSPLGSPGAGDCASCVASMLEIARLMVDSSWVPPRPIIFLFNGAEELFLLGSHGFMKTHKWHNSVGAFINVEASGSGGLDLVCQSGPGSWPSRVYAQSAIYPMGNSVAQDVFHAFPGDTDYRIFAEDHGNIPGLDIIFVLGGYFYHTASDTMERLLPGSIQARGENLFSLIKAFTSSRELRNAKERKSLTLESNGTWDDRTVFFDYLSWFMILYSRRQALIFHSLPIIIFFFMPLISCFPNIGVRVWFAFFCDLLKGMLIHALGILLAIIVPIIFAILRLLFSSSAMNWFAHPYLAFLMFIPSSLVGLLIPRILWRCFPISQDVSLLKTSKEVVSDRARFWGAFGLYASITFAYLLSGLSGGFMTFFLSAFMIPAWISFCLLSKYFGHRSLKSVAGYVLPLIPCLAYSVYFGGFLVQFVIEKMGMIGSLPQPYGYFIPDIVVAAAFGVVTGWCVGPLVPIVGHWLARSAIVQLLLHVTVIALALSSQFFPYSPSAPKRVVIQQTFRTSAETGLIVESSYDFSVVDANSLAFLFKYAPDVAKELQISSEISVKTSSHSDRSAWMALFPVSFLFSGSLKFPARSDDIVKHYRYLPYVSTYKPITISSTGSRKVHLELSLGSLEEVWVAVLNITGPLTSWSFADNRVPAPEIVHGDLPSYILRLSGRSHENWTFWLETNNSAAVRVDVAILDQYLDDDSRKLKSSFPSWVDVIAYSSFISSYVF
ncbi:Zn-dependent exopeptidases superfamily protein [Tasmannia lanceolata]|uniref:Zn-dependent exopeptidases superfamily protein n=1 Tax=Tasmannia lanceolata TaxID=3420 RepID=UPI004064A8C7